MEMNANTGKDPYKDEVVQEVVARIKVKDIKTYYNLKESLAVKWWEPAVSLLLFVAMLVFGMLAIDIALQETGRIRYVLTWLIIFGIVVVWVIEFLIFKLHALRRLFQIQMRLMVDMQKEIDALSKRFDKSNDPPAKK